MSKAALSTFLFFLISIVILSVPATSQAAMMQAAQPTPTAKVIKDPAEYNAYITALNTKDPAAKGAAMEAFVAHYPNSVVLADALEQAMAAYQQAGNQAKVLEIADRILQIDPTHVRALAITVALDRAKATNGDQAALKEGCDNAQKGLQQLPGWTKPAGISDTDFAKLRNQMADIFNGAAGFCALQSKDYAGARTYYEKAFQLDSSNLQDVYQLAVADLQMSPKDLNGFWYCSKAINLAQRMNNPPAVMAITSYCKASYHHYHGGDDGWDQIVAGASSQTTLPAGFSTAIKAAPTACDLAVQAVEQNSTADLSFSDKEFILSKVNCSPANKAAADKVWQSIQDIQKGGAARLKIPVKVVAANKDSLDVAITDDNQASNKADMRVAMEKPLLHPPAPGSMTEVIGVITQYVPEPFMFRMEKGELAAVKTHK